MKRNELLTFLWEKYQDLNFGEIQEVTMAVQSAADSAVWKIRKAKTSIKRKKAA